MAEKQIEIVIKATDLSAKELDAARRRLAGFKDDAEKVSGGFGGMLKQLGPLGPALAGAFSVAAVKSLATDIMATADGLVKMSDRTGIGIEALQQLDAAANQGGNTLDQVTAAINKMQVNLAGEDKGAVKALGALGLKLDDLRAMRPEDQFATLGRAIQSVEDPADKAKLRVLLFGKAGNEIAGTLNQDMASIAASVVTMKDETARALDEAGDRLSQQAKNIKAQMANWLVETIEFSRKASDAVIEGVMAMEVLVKRRIADMYASVAAVNIVPGVGAKLKAEGERWAASAKEAEQALAIFQQKTDDYTQSQAKASDAAKKGTGAFLDLGEATKQTAEQKKKAREELKKLEDAEKAQIDTIQQLIVSRGNAEQAADESAQAERNALKAINEMIVGLQNQSDAAEVAAAAAFVFTDGVDQNADAVKRMGRVLTESKTWWQESSGAVERVGQAMSGLSRVAEMSGHKTTSALLSVGATMADLVKQGKLFEAGMAGAMGLITTFADKLFKTEGKKVNDMRDEFIAAAGGLHELNVKAHDAGLTLDRLLRAGNVKDYEAAVKELNDAFDAQKTAVEEQNRALEEQKRIRADIEAQIEASSREILDLRQSLIPTWDDVASAVDRYKLSVDGAGQQIQGLKLLSDTTKIVNDWEMLTRAGWDTNGMLDGMQEELSKVAQEAIKYGTELPAQMQPILQSLADQGKLTDANGKKLTDLSGIKFGAPIESDADKINKSIEKLVQSLADLVEKLNGLPGVAESVSQDLQANLGTPPWDDWATPVWPDVAGYGGMKAADVPGFAAGVRGFGGGLAVVGEDGPELVRLPRGADVIPMGTGAPLSIAEGLSSDLARAVASAVASAVRQVQLYVSVESTSYIDGRQAARGVAPYLPAAAKAYGGIS